MKHDSLWETLLEIRDSQIRMERDIAYHIKRTDTLEDFVEQQEIRLSKVEETKQGWIFTGKVIATSVGIIATIIGVIATIQGLIK